MHVKVINTKDSGLTKVTFAQTSGALRLTGNSRGAWTLGLGAHFRFLRASQPPSLGQTPLSASLHALRSVVLSP